MLSVDDVNIKVNITCDICGGDACLIINPHEVEDFKDDLIEEIEQHGWVIADDFDPSWSICTEDLELTCPSCNKPDLSEKELLHAIYFVIENKATERTEFEMLAKIQSLMEHNFKE